MARCFVTRDLPGPALDRLRDAHEVTVWPEARPPSPAELAEGARSAEGLLSMLTDTLDADFLDGCPELKAIANYAVGYDNIDVSAARERGIRVGNTPDVLTGATADLAFALLLAIARGLPEAADSVRRGEWQTWGPTAYLGREVHGATLGIIGMGRIGRAVAQRAAGFEMEVLHTGRGGVPLLQLLARSDFVSIHCPLTPETHHLINEAALDKMKPTAFLINTARGPIVDQAALRRALTEGEIAGAALDVTYPEPLAGDDPLLTAPNLLVVPHIGSATGATREQMATVAVENLLAALDGRPMPDEVS
ncbi:MAG TPA: D-glycerate dehydrogenase [Solirubrobacteraceae bacterium]